MKQTTIEPASTSSRFDRNLLNAADMSIDEARHLVDAYYQIQENRKAVGNPARALVAAQERHSLVSWLLDENTTLEKQIEYVLDSWTDTIPAAAWAKGIVGIDPVISAGLSAHIDIKRCPTVGRIWRFAGLDPTVEWRPKTRRPWNPSLKTLCWKIGESFVKVCGCDGDFYGKLYIQRKQFEQKRNDAGELADQAKHRLDHFNIGKETDTYRWYAQGKLPPAHIQARAKRWTVKLFLAHFHHVAWTLATGTPPAKPYVLTHIGHADYIAPPNFQGASIERRL